MNMQNATNMSTPGVGGNQQMRNNAWIQASKQQQQQSSSHFTNSKVYQNPAQQTPNNPTQSMQVNQQNYIQSRIDKNKIFISK